MLQATAQECKTSGGQVHTLVADVGKQEDCKQLAEEAIKKMGGVDLLILNAAYSPAPSFFSEIENSVRL